MIWTEKNSDTLAHAIKGWARLDDNRRMLRWQIQAYLTEKGFPKLGEKFLLASEGSAPRKAIVRGSKGITCPLCKFKFVSPKRVCRTCYKTPEGRQLMNVLKREKTVKTSMARYGVPHPVANEKSKAKRRSTLMERYGCDNSAKCPGAQERQQATMEARYGKGVTNPGQIPGHFKRLVAKLRETYDDPSITGPINVPGAKDKSKEQMHQRYGGYTWNSPVLKEKARITCRARYGVDHPGAAPELIKRRHATVMEKYGGLMKASPILANRMREGMVKKYGVAHAMQNPKMLSQAMRSSYSVKSAKVNGRKVEYQGYELFVLRALENKYGPRTVRTQFEGIPMIDLSNGRKYQPDLYLKPLKLTVEVKSTWTMIRGLRKNRIIQKDANTQGIPLRFIVVDAGKKTSAIFPLNWYTWSDEKVTTYFRSKLYGCLSSLN